MYFSYIINIGNAQTQASKLANIFQIKQTFGPNSSIELQTSNRSRIPCNYATETVKKEKQQNGLYGMPQRKPTSSRGLQGADDDGDEIKKILKMAQEKIKIVQYVYSNSNLN